MNVRRELEKMTDVKDDRGLLMTCYYNFGCIKGLVRT